MHFQGQSGIEAGEGKHRSQTAKRLTARVRQSDFGRYSRLVLALWLFRSLNTQIENALNGYEGAPMKSPSLKAVTEVTSLAPQFLVVVGRCDLISDPLMIVEGSVFGHSDLISLTSYYPDVRTLSINARVGTS